MLHNNEKARPKDDSQGLLRIKNDELTSAELGSFAFDYSGQYSLGTDVEIEHKKRQIIASRALPTEYSYIFHNALQQTRWAVKSIPLLYRVNQEAAILIAQAMLEHAHLLTDLIKDLQPSERVTNKYLLGLGYAQLRNVLQFNKLLRQQMESHGIALKTTQLQTEAAAQQHYKECCEQRGLELQDEYTGYYKDVNGVYQYQVPELENIVFPILEKAFSTTFYVSTALDSPTEETRQSCLSKTTNKLFTHEGEEGEEAEEVADGSVVTVVIPGKTGFLERMENQTSLITTFSDEVERVIDKDGHLIKEEYYIVEQISQAPRGNRLSEEQLDIYLSIYKVACRSMYFADLEQRERQGESIDVVIKNPDLAPPIFERLDHIPGNLSDYIFWFKSNYSESRRLLELNNLIDIACRAQKESIRNSIADFDTLMKQHIQDSRKFQCHSERVNEGRKFNMREGVRIHKKVDDQWMCVLDNTPPLDNAATRGAAPSLGDYDMSDARYAEYTARNLVQNTKQMVENYIVTLETELNDHFQTDKPPIVMLNHSASTLSPIIATGLFEFDNNNEHMVAQIELAVGIDNNSYSILPLKHRGYSVFIIYNYTNTGVNALSEDSLLGWLAQKSRDVDQVGLNTIAYAHACECELYARYGRFDYGFKELIGEEILTISHYIKQAIVPEVEINSLASGIWTRYSNRVASLASNAQQYTKSPNHPMGKMVMRIRAHREMLFFANKEQLNFWYGVWSDFKFLCTYPLKALGIAIEREERSSKGANIPLILAGYIIIVLRWQAIVNCKSGKDRTSHLISHMVPALLAFYCRKDHFPDTKAEIDELHHIMNRLLMSGHGLVTSAHTSRADSVQNLGSAWPEAATSFIQSTVNPQLVATGNAPIEFDWIEGMAKLADHKLWKKLAPLKPFLSLIQQTATTDFTEDDDEGDLPLEDDQRHHKEAISTTANPLQTGQEEKELELEEVDLRGDRQSLAITPSHASLDQTVAQQIKELKNETSVTIKFFEYYFSQYKTDWYNLIPFSLEITRHIDEDTNAFKSWLGLNHGLQFNFSVTLKQKQVFMDFSRTPFYLKAFICSLFIGGICSLIHQYSPLVTRDVQWVRPVKSDFNQGHGFLSSSLGAGVRAAIVTFFSAPILFYNLRRKVLLPKFERLNAVLHKPPSSDYLEIIDLCENNLILDISTKQKMSADVSLQATFINKCLNYLVITLLNAWLLVVGLVNLVALFGVGNGIPYVFHMEEHQTSTQTLIFDSIGFALAAICYALTYSSHQSYIEKKERLHERLVLFTLTPNNFFNVTNGEVDNCNFSMEKPPKIGEAY